MIIFYHAIKNMSSVKDQPRKIVFIPYKLHKHILLGDLEPNFFRIFILNHKINSYGLVKMVWCW